MARVTRIAVTGTESSHVDHFIRFLNVERRGGDARVTVLVGGDSDRNRELAALGGIDTVVDSPGEAATLADAAIVSNRDGRLHRREATPFLDAGLPVLVDKPLAASSSDAEAMLATASAGGAMVTSFSAVRFADDVQYVREQVPTLGGLRAVVLTGPADPGSEHAGLFFYGIHLVEAAFELIGDHEPASAPAVQVTRRGDIITAVTEIGEVQVVLVFVTPTSGSQVPFHVTAAGRHGILAREITLGPDYCAPGLARFLTMLDTSRPMYSDAALLRTVRLMEAVAADV